MVTDAPHIVEVFHSGPIGEISRAWVFLWLDTHAKSPIWAIIFTAITDRGILALLVLISIMIKPNQHTAVAKAVDI